MHRQHVRLIAAFVTASSLLTSHAVAQSRTLDASTVRRWASLLAVQDARLNDTVVVDSALDSKIPQLRSAAVRTIGLNRMKARYPLLRRLLMAPHDTAVSRDAAFALGLAVDSASCGALRDALQRPEVAVAAAWALGELTGHCGGFDATLQLAPTAPVRAALLRVAGKWTPFPDTAVGAAYQAAKSSEERLAAVYAFGRARRPFGAQFGIAASGDPAPRIREAAARLLAAPLQNVGDSAAALARLRELLGDADSHVRIAGVRAIATYRAAALAPLASRWATERDPNVRVTLAQFIGGVAPDTAALWAEWWRSDSSHMLRRSLISSAWQAGAIAMLAGGAPDALFAHPDFRIRLAMIEGAAAQRADRSARLLAARRDDPDPRVRAAIISAMANVSPALRDSLEWSAVIDHARRDDDVGVRTAALETSLRDARAADVSIALAGYQRATRDSSGDARETALGLIANAWRQDSLAFPDTLVALLRNLAPAVDPLLRQRVRNVTALSHWSGIAGRPSRTPAEYEAIVRRIIIPSLLGRPPQLTIVTARGAVQIVLDGVQTPMTVDHLSHLARKGYFRDLRFHRVVPAFVAQGGDPRGDGTGGPGVSIRDELSRSPYLRGAVGMALSGPDTGGSQFFLTLAPQHHLDGHYTVFGRVTSGFAAMDALVQGDAIRNISPSPE